MTARSILPALALTALLALAPEARAQIHPGVHVARAAHSFGGVNGAGASVALNVPLFPLGLFVAGEYFFPGCDNCSLWGGSADVHFSMPFPIVKPYGTAGLVMRNTKVSGTQVRNRGLGVGAGVTLNTLVVGAYAEGRYEIMRGGDDQLVFRLGIRL